MNDIDEYAFWHDNQIVYANWPKLKTICLELAIRFYSKRANANLVMLIAACFALMKNIDDAGKVPENALRQWALVIYKILSKGAQ